MAKAMTILRKLCALHGAKTAAEGVFDTRLRRMTDLRRVSVARAVLFRTRPARQEA